MNKTISDIAAAVSWIRNYHNRNISITEGLARIVLNQRVSGSILSANTGEMTSLVFQVYYNSMAKAAQGAKTVIYHRCVLITNFESKIHISIFNF